MRLTDFVIVACRLALRGGMICALACAFAASVVDAQSEFEREPIRYGEAPRHDPVTRLQAQLDAGEIELPFDGPQGYLAGLLNYLKIPRESQVLVGSKTSLQLHRISPDRPRALYFNDEVAIGWVRGSDMLEVMSIDPEQGALFYTLPQIPGESPRFVRDQGQCLTCHESSRTQGVPGGLIRSTFVDADGQPQFGSGTFTIDHRSPFEKRWGGWYVTGTHGEMRHMGNVFISDRKHPERLDREAGANVTDLTELLDVSNYLTPQSDIVALMVLEHQTQMQNFLTLASYECRLAAHQDAIMNKALERPDDFVSESAQRRIAAAGDKVLRCLLFCDEFPLTSPVRGVSGFTEEFSRQGPRDSQGRSLRDFDLRTRMFKYPCSYLIDSPSFDHLPSGVHAYIAQRLHDVLTGADSGAEEEFAHLSAADRRAILEILTETKPDLWAPRNGPPAAE